MSLNRIVFRGLVSFALLAAGGLWTLNAGRAEEPRRREGGQTEAQRREAQRRETERRETERREGDRREGERREGERREGDRREGTVKREVETQTKVEVRGDTMVALGLIGNPAIHRDLKLTDQQVGDLRKLSQQVVEIQRRTIEQQGNIRGEGAEARKREIGEAAQKRLVELNGRVTQILNESQKKRYRELTLQNRNMIALGDEDVSKALQLSEEQMARLKELWAEAQRKQAESVRGEKKPDERASAEREILKEFQQKAGDVLTADQRTQFDRMKGEPFRAQPAREGEKPRGTGERRESGDTAGESAAKPREGERRPAESGERRKE